MKFKIIVRDVDGEDTWEEEYDENTQDPRAWAENVIKFFNSTLKPDWEKPRELVDVVVLDERDIKHDWEKRTDGMSVNFRGNFVDLMRCRRCGITGKRYGISGRVKIDSKYRKKAFRRCDTALEELKRHPEKY